MSDGTRTRDRLDHNQELYQLSYAHQARASVAAARRAQSCGCTIGATSSATASTLSSCRARPRRRRRRCGSGRCRGWGRGGSAGRGSCPSRGARPRTGSSRPRRPGTRSCGCAGRSPCEIASRFLASERCTIPRPLRPAAPPSVCDAWSIVFVRPSRSSTSGSQPSRSRARVMSGWRTCGSSTGSASNTISERDSVSSTISLRHLEQRHLVRVADVHRLVHARLHQQHEPADQVVDVTERARLRAVAEHRQRLVGQRLRQEGRDRAAVVRPHPRPVGVEDPDDARVHALLAVVGHRQRLGVALRLVVDAARADRVHVAPVRLRLRVHERVAVDLGGRRQQEARALGTSPGRACCASRTRRPSACAAAAARSRSGSPARPCGRRSRPARRSRSAR